jgi:hypothetical protein
VYDALLEEVMSSEDNMKRTEAQMVVLALLRVMGLVARDTLVGRKDMMNGTSSPAVSDEVRERLVERIGGVLGNKVADSNDPLMIRLAIQVEPAE